MSTWSTSYDHGGATSVDVGRLRNMRAMIVGLGNIGSFLAVLLAPLVSFIRLVDRDTIELHNTSNQFFAPDLIGVSKVQATAERIERLAPSLQIERRVADIEDLPWGDFADIDVALAGLDSLRARQALAEKLFALRVPHIDGAVGDPMLVRVQVLLPGHACLECGWGWAHYRQLSAEYPCHSGAAANGFPTTAPSCAGAAAAAVMVAHCAQLFSSHRPAESYEVNGDLLAGRFVTSRRRRNEHCRFSHQLAPQPLRIERPFDEATVDDLCSVVRREFGDPSVQLEFRRGILAGDLFGESRFAALQQLDSVKNFRLHQLGLTPKDRVVVHAGGDALASHIRLDSVRESL